MEEKVITDARWHKFVNELETTKKCEWPTKREVIIWEAIAKIKTFPIGSS